jgi:hypothetical protein
MRVAATFFLLILLVEYSKAQEKGLGTRFDSTIHKRIYGISKSNFQYIQLIENQDGTFNGTLTNTIWKVTRKEERTKMIQQKLTIPPNHVKQLMYIGFSNSIETLPSCQAVENCVIGLDGASFSFGIRTLEVERDYSYWEPESDYQDSTITQIIKVRSILSGVQELINMQLLYDRFTCELPSGRYAFGTIIMTKRNTR